MSKKRDPRECVCKPNPFQCLSDCQCVGCGCAGGTPELRRVLKRFKKQLSGAFLRERLVADTLAASLGVPASERYEVVMRVVQGERVIAVGASEVEAMSRAMFLWGGR